MKIFLTAFAAIWIFISCGNASKDENVEKPVTVQNLSIPDIPGTTQNESANRIGETADTTKAPTGQPGNINKNQRTEPDIKEDWDKKIIKNASLNLEVKDYYSYYTRMRDQVKRVGGYIAREEQSQSDYKIENNIVIKVPVDQFDDAVHLLSQQVEKINEKKISSADVTAEYVDVRSRIEAKKQVRQKYLDLMKQAKNMEEILSIQSEINEIQEEIESASGRIEYLSHSAVFSTINLSYYQVLDVSAKDSTEPGFGAKIAAAFREGAEWVADLFVGLISIWPLLLLVFTVIVILKRWKKNMASPGHPTSTV